MARIAIITAHLNKEYDGVADYSRLLADELVRQGHQVLLIGIMQQESAWIRTVHDNSAANGHSIADSPAISDYQNRLDHARNIIRKFDPDLVSFQYVSFSFGRYGLPRTIGHDVRNISGNRRLQLMSHELWTGISESGDIKTRILRLLQKRNYRRFLQQLRPAVVHVSNPAYVALLRRIGCSATVLPLFGNIPVTQLQSGELQSFCDSLSNPAWKFLIFGSIHPEWNPGPVLSRIIGLCDKSNVRPVFISVGSQGRGGHIWREIMHNYTAQAAFMEIGRASDDCISGLMNSSDFGLVTTPLSLIGKSGTAAAMLEHDMPIIVNREDPCVQIGHVEPAEGYGRFIRLNDDFEIKMQSELHRPRNPQSRIAAVAQMMIASRG